MHGSHQVQRFRQAIRKPQLANRSPVSVSYPIPLGLNLFYSITHTAGAGLKHFLSRYHVPDLPRSLLL